MLQCYILKMNSCVILNVNEHLNLRDATITDGQIQITVDLIWIMTESLAIIWPDCWKIWFESTWFYLDLIWIVRDVISDLNELQNAAKLLHSVVSNEGQSCAMTTMCSV